MKSRKPSIAFLTAGFAGALILAAELGAQTITQFPVPAGTGPRGIVAGPDGKLWFTETTPTGGAGLRIGRLATDGTFSEVGANVRGSFLTTGPDGNVWVTSADNNGIIRLTPDGVQTLFALPNASSSPFAIVTGPDLNLWFTERHVSGGGVVGRVTPAGVITEFPIPGGDSPGAAIQPGPDGALWFTTSTGLQRITTAGVVTQVLPVAIPAEFGWGPDGRIWFTDAGANTISALTVGTGSVQTFTVPTPRSFPASLTAGSDGAIWFIEEGVQRIGRVTTSGVFTEYPVPATSNLNAAGITLGPDGDIWFTEPRAERVSRVSVPGFACASDARTLCLSGGRFQVRASYDSDAAFGSGMGVRLTSDTGYFWFFSQNNVEVVVKVLDACTINQNFWVFAGGLTNVGVTLTVTDTQSGVMRSYRNVRGTAYLPLQQTGDFGVCSALATDVSEVAEPELASFEAICTTDPTTLCLAGGRFQVRASYDTDTASGNGIGVALTSDTGYFWFFSQTNVEVIVKVLNACPINQNFWVFAGGLTNVGVTLAVTDTQSGLTRTYRNVRGTAYLPLQQTGDFGVCP